MNGGVASVVTSIVVFEVMNPYCLVFDVACNNNLPVQSFFDVAIEIRVVSRGPHAGVL